MMDEILIIGGNAAGLTAASRVRRLDSRLRIVVLEKSPYMSYSTCGIPYFLAGQVPADDLISFTPQTFQKERNIRVHVRTRADSIEPARRRVQATNLETGERAEFEYGKLLIATGVRANRPEIPGTDLAGVFSIVGLEDAFSIQKEMARARRVAIVGGGYVGLEAADSVRSLGKDVVLFEREPQVMPSLDRDMAQIVEYELQRFGVTLRTGSRVTALTGADGRVNGVKSAGGLGIEPCDMVLLDTGVRPRVELAQTAGLRIGPTGAIAVNAYLETSVPAIFAAGNCAETNCAIRKRPVFHYVGTVAAKQGRVAGENMVHRRSRFDGSIGTTVLKVFELSVARTGLSSREAEAERLNVVSARIEAQDRAGYYPGSRKVWVRLLASRESRRLLGAQVAGYGDASKSIDVAAAAIQSGMTIDALAQLDLSYSPPFSSLWDPLHVAAQALQRLL